MASPSTTEATEAPTPTIRDFIGHDADGFVVAEEDEEDDDEDEEEEDDEWDTSKRMSRLSMEGSDGGDADDENEGGGGGVLDGLEEDEFDDEVSCSDVNDVGATYLPPALVPSSASLPGTPDRAAAQAMASQSSSMPWRWPAGPSGKEYASETEARWPPAGASGRRRRHRHRRERVMREVWLERAWRMRKQRVEVLGSGGGGEPSSTLSPRARAACRVAMDVEEVRACRDLGLDLPCDCAVEIPCYYALSGVDTASSGGNSPASGSWRISSPGDDPKDVKARLKVWAQAVALASASRLGGS